MSRKIPDDRLAEVAQLLAAGAGPEQIEDHCAKVFGVQPRQARRYRKLVEDQLASGGSTPVSLMLQAIYRRAMATGKYSAAATIAIQLGKNRPTAPEVLALYRELGDPPTHDPLLCVEWTFKSLVVAQREIMLDPSLDRDARTKKLQENARAIVAMVPREELVDAHNRVQEHHAKQAEDTLAPETTVVAGGKTRSLRADPSGKWQGEAREKPVLPAED